MAEKNLMQISEFNGYFFHEVLGSGHNSIVYRVTKESKEYALKLTHASDEITEELSRNYLSKMASIARLSHPHIVQLYDYGIQDDFYYSVMEYLPGPVLSEQISKMGKLDSTYVVKVITEIALALSELQSNGIVHRDIKPQNIICTSNGDTKLLDFDLSKEENESRSEALEGTLFYISPEQSGLLNCSIDIRTDFYSLGITAFECLTGAIPFKGQSLEEQLNLHISEPLPNLRKLLPGLHQPLVEIIEKMVSKDPDDRYLTAAGLVYDLNHLEEFINQIEKGEEFQIGSQDIFAKKVEKFCGRKEELSLLESIWQKPRSISIITGTSGLGKSRLINEFLHNKNNLIEFQSKCLKNERLKPYATIKSLLGSIEELVNNWKINEVERFEIFVDVLKNQERQFISFVPIFQNFSNEFLERKVGVPEDEKRILLFNIGKFFREIEKLGNLVLKIDDLQWIDHESLEILHFTYNNFEDSSLRMILSCRDDEESLKQSQIFVSMFDQKNVGVLQLKPFINASCW